MNTKTVSAFVLSLAMYAVIPAVSCGAEGGSVDQSKLTDDQKKTVELAMNKFKETEGYRANAEAKEKQTVAWSKAESDLRDSKKKMAENDALIKSLKVEEVNKSGKEQEKKDSSDKKRSE